MLIDPWLSPFKESLKRRYSLAEKWIKTLDDHEGGLEKFSKGYERYGLHVQSNGDIVYREWAPNATQAFLIGDFSVSWLYEAWKIAWLISYRQLEQRLTSYDQGLVW